MQLNFLRLPDWYVGDHLEAGAAALAPALAREAPERIYLPHVLEWHPDHKAALPIVQAALLDSNIPTPTLMTYEVWTPMAEHYDGQDITSVIRRKLRAIRCHRSQVAQLPYDRAVRGLNMYRGAVAWACPYAEIFNFADPAVPIAESQ